MITTEHRLYFATEHLLYMIDKEQLAAATIRLYFATEHPLVLLHSTIRLHFATEQPSGCTLLQSMASTLSVASRTRNFDIAAP